MPGEHTLREIMEQPEAWGAAVRSFDGAIPALDRLFRDRDPDEVVFTGCGSSYYLSLTAAAVFQQVGGLRAKAVPASEILQFPGSVFVPGARPLLVASSRSGTTTEIVWALEVTGRRGIATLGLTCASRSPLARPADLCIPSPRGRETSVVMTKSFSSLLLLGLLLAAHRDASRGLPVEIRRLPTLGRRVVKVALSLAVDIGAAASRFVFLGGGPANGIAWEAMLKMTEMAQGAAVMRIRDGWPGGGEADVDVNLNVHLSDEARCLLYVAFAQALAYHRSVGAGLDPDRPPHLTAVVHL